MPAAGRGQRLGAGTDKAFVDLGGRPLLAWTIHALAAHPQVAGIVVAVSPERLSEARDLATAAGGAAPGRMCVVAGGAERQDSVRLALAAVPADADYVMVHDAARPFLEADVVDRLLAAAAAHGAAAPALPLADTVVRRDGDRLAETTDRGMLRAVQTPQAFRAQLLRDAHQWAAATGTTATDDAGLVHRYLMDGVDGAGGADMGNGPAAGGGPGSASAPRTALVALVAGSQMLRKITTPDDLAWARAVVAGRVPGATAASAAATPPTAAGAGARGAMSLAAVRPPVAVGLGIDLHRFAPGRPLILGGVRIPHDRGLLGHSDADVIAHAIADAVLGAAALGDIGQHFPDDDPAYENADSLVLLAHVRERVTAAGWHPAHVDVMVLAQEPRLAPHMAAMRARLADALGLAPDAVSVKASTTEGMGPIGRGEGIRAEAVATLVRLETPG